MNSAPESIPSESRRAPLRWVPWLGWILAVGCALATGYAALRTAAVRTESALHRESAELAELETRSVRQTLEAERIVLGRQIADLQRATDPASLQVARLTLPDGLAGAAATAVWNPLRHDGLLDVRGFPPAGPGQAYRVWLIAGGTGAPVAAGAFQVDAHGDAHAVIRPSSALDGPTGLRVTRDPESAAAPAGPVVATGSW